MFHDADGGYLRLSNLAKNSFKPILARAALPSVGLYTLRHTCATLLLLADQPAKVVSERLGHSSITLTLDTYSHVLPTMQKRAADVMGTILGAAQKAKSPQSAVVEIGYSQATNRGLGQGEESTQPLAFFRIRAHSSMVRARDS